MITRPLAKCTIDERLGASPVQVRIGVELGDVDDGETRDVVLRLRPIRPDEDLTGEQVVPGIFRDDPNRDPVGGVGARETILHVNIAPLQVSQEASIQCVEAGGFERTIDRPPPDPILGRGFLHDELVIGRTARVLTRSHDQCAAGGQQPLAPPDGVLDQSRRAQIPIGLVDVQNSVLVQAVMTWIDPARLHALLRTPSSAGNCSPARGDGAR